MTDRGYTGHEQLDHLQLVHMNGRIYDPVIGRMLTPDPLIQAPQNLQSFNRYSYVWNNPLSNTDPSGFVTEKLGSSDSQNGSSNGTKPTVITPENLSMQDLLNTISEKVNCTSESSTERKTFSEDGGSSTTTESADITRDVISNASTGSGESSEESATEENPKFKNGLSKSYGTKEETIIAAIDHLLGKKSDNEWGGYIVKVTGPNGEPMFAFTEPIEGTSKDLDLDPENDEVPVPRDDIISAYHTHTPGGPNPEEFSGTSEITDGRWYSVGNEVGDKNWSKRYDMPVILGTPTGEIKKYRGYKSSYNESVLDRSDHTWDTVDPL